MPTSRKFVTFDVVRDTHAHLTLGLNFGIERGLAVFQLALLTTFKDQANKHYITQQSLAYPQSGANLFQILSINGYVSLNLENGSFLNSDNFDATDLRF